MREPLVDSGVSIESLANRRGAPVAKRFARFRLKPTDHLKKSPIGPSDLQMGQDGQATELTSLYLSNHRQLWTVRSIEGGKFRHY